MFNYVFLIVLCFMFVLYCLRLGIEFSRLMAHYKCILLLLLLLTSETSLPKAIGQATSPMIVKV